MVAILLRDGGLLVLSGINQALDNLSCWQIKNVRSAHSQDFSLKCGAALKCTICSLVMVYSFNLQCCLRVVCGVCRLWCVLWIVGEKKKCQHSALWHPDGTTHQCIIPILHIISIKHQLRILNQFHPHHSWESWAVKMWRKPWSCFPASSTHSPARIALACQTNISVSTFQSKWGESKIPWVVILF